MTQQIAYELLQKLGGYDIPSRPVHVRDIGILCKMEYPDVYYDHYLHTSLGRLRHWKYIAWDNKALTYTIINELEAPNIHRSPITEKDLIVE